MQIVGVVVAGGSSVFVRPLEHGADPHRLAWELGYRIVRPLSATGQGDDLGPTCLDEPTGRTYSMAPGDQPTIVYGIEYPAEQITIRVFRATADGRKGALVGTFLDQTHVPRMVGQSAIAWDGSATTPGRRPRPARVGAGSYILEMAALRPLGRANVPADWERWTSPAFTVTFAGTTSGPGR